MEREAGEIRAASTDRPGVRPPSVAVSPQMSIDINYLLLEKLHHVVNWLQLPSTYLLLGELHDVDRVAHGVVIKMRIFLCSLRPVMPQNGADHL